MKSHPYLAIFSAIAVLCFLAMLGVTMVWMYLPIRIVYQESSPVQTELHFIAVMQHGKAYYVTPGQKNTLNLIKFYTPIIWFSGFVYLLLFTALGGFEKLRLLKRRKSEGGVPLD